jgi:hypothetical protein
MRRPGISVMRVLLVAGAVASCTDFDTTRTIPPRGTLGQELYIALCDRVAAQALPEDVGGASWHAVCHPDATGAFASTVDQAELPPFDPNAVDVAGHPVPLAVEQQERAYRVARIEALARDRTKVVGALDGAVPDVTIPVKNLAALDPAQSCQAEGTDTLPHALAAVLGRMVDLENDRTLPLLTEGLARVLDDVKSAPAAQSALARFDARQGYRPLQVALGAARPLLAYPRLVPMAQSLLSLVATDSDPFNPAGAIDPGLPLGPGNRRPIPGKAAAQMQELLAVGREEMRTATPDASATLLTESRDPSIPVRLLLSRPRTTIELVQRVALQTDPAFDVGLPDPRFLVRRDPRAYAALPPTPGGVPAPFVDADHDGLPDVDALGRFVTASGQPVPSPFFSPDGVDGARDPEGRAVGTTAPTLYDYFDVGTSFVASLEDDARTLVDPDPADGREALVNALGGAYVLFGDRDAQPATVRQYAPDPTGAAPTQPVALTYRAFHPATSPLVDLLYAAGVVFSDPAFDDLLDLARTLMASHPHEMARLVGLGLRIKAIADAHPEAHLPAASTLWDELLDDLANIAHVQDSMGGGGIVEDLILALAQDKTAALQTTFAAYLQYGDGLTYNHNSTTGGLSNALNGPAWNLASSDTQPLHVPVDRSQPDVGESRSAFQKFIQLLHDANGLDVCTKSGAVANVAFNVPPLGTVHFDFPTDPLTGVACAFVGAPAPPNPMPACGILRIQNVDALLLNVVLDRAQFDIRDPCLQKLVTSPITNLVGGPDQFLETQSGIVGFDTKPTVPGVARLTFFDTAHDGLAGDTNPATLQTHDFLGGLFDPVPTTVCAPTPFTDSDGTVLHLRTCSTFADAMRGRDPGFLFPLEQFSFVDDVQALASAFANHGEPLLFVNLFDTLHLHWGDAQQTTDICDPTLPRTDFRWCSQDGAVTYEPLLADVLTNTDLFATLHDTAALLQSVTIAHCDGQDPQTHACTRTSARTGVQVIAEALRVMVDPGRNAGLTDRNGAQTAPRNDGTTNPQVTPLYLLIDAFKGFDAAFASWAQAHPGDDRHPAWLAARSRLVDTFLGVQGTGGQSSWANTAVPVILPTAIDALHSQILARCPDRSSRAACTWWTQQMPQNVSDSIAGPTFAAVMDLLDAVRADGTARGELERLVQYLLDPASPGDARVATISASADILQLMSDDTNLAPFFAAVHDVLGAQQGQPGAQGGAVARRGIADAAINVVARVFAAARDAQGAEVCAREVDPDGAIEAVLARLVTPLGASQPSPIEALVDVVADVNRAHPEETTKLDGDDYANIANEISEFCVDPASGLEQVYEVIREATMPSSAP